MPVAIIETPASPPPPGPRRKLWTRAECIRMEAAGVLDYDHFELIEGELIDTRGKNRPHCNALFLISIWVAQVFGPFFIQHEGPIDVAPGDNPINEPEPDLSVLVGPFTDYPKGNPPPSDVRLVIEVSDTTLAFDRTVKARLYARAGIAEYWIADVAGRRLLVHRDPQKGQYQSITAYGENETVAPLAAPDSPLAIRDAFQAGSAN